MENPTFDKVRDLAIRFMRELPKQLQDELYEALNRGVDILDSEPQMVTYLYAFGPMHQAKLNYAFKHLPEEFLAQPEINIIDYGCGQALGTMCYTDFLRESGYSQKVKTITLIEPSEMCLKRAALHASAFFPNAEIKTVNKTFNELEENAVYCAEDIPTLHILSNVLDMLSFNLKKFANLVKGCLKGYNQFICVGPYFNYSDKDKRMDEFLSLMDGEEDYCETFDKYELDAEKAWTAQIFCFSVGMKEEENLSTIVTKEDLENAVEDTFGVLYSKDGRRLLKCNNSHLKSYSIPYRTKVVCDKAFYFGDGNECFLEQIIIPNSVLFIGHSVFKGCSFLQQVTISNSIQTIRQATFWKCTSLKSIVLPNSINTIEDGAFGYCSALEQVALPNSITNIGFVAFRNCVSLAQITIPNSVSRIGFCAFMRCSSLKRITIPSSVTKIDDGVFEGCTSLLHIDNNSYYFVVIQDMLINRITGRLIAYFGKSTKVVIPSCVSSIGYETFKGCTSLQEIIISDSTTDISNNAFMNCSSLKQITLPTKITSITSATFFGCSSLRNITIPDSVGFIGNQAFDYCTSLKQIVLPNRVYCINGSIFNNCKSLEKIIIPKGSVEKFKKMLDEELWDKLVES